MKFNCRSSEVVSDRTGRAFYRSGVLELQHLLYPRFSTEFGILVFFTNFALIEFQVKYLALFLLFSIIGSFGWFWMGSLHKNIQLMLEFLKGPFLVLHFSYHTLMTFLIILSVLLLFHVSCQRNRKEQSVKFKVFRLTVQNLTKSINYFPPKKLIVKAI